MTISVEKIEAYIQSHPEHPEYKDYSAEQMISIMRADAEYVKLSEQQNFSLFYNPQSVKSSENPWPVSFGHIPGTLDIKPGNYPINAEPHEIEAYSFLSSIFSQSSAAFNQQIKTEGWISNAVNAARTIANSESSRKKVEKALNKTKSDLKFLDAALRGSLVVVGEDDTPLSFEEAFKRTRGVSYSKEKVQKCQSAAMQYMRADMIDNGIKSVLGTLLKTSTATTSEAVRVKNFDNAVLKAFKQMGVTNAGDINKFLAQVCEKNANNPIIKEYGGDFKLSKNPDGRYSIVRRTKTGYAALTPEQARLVTDEFVSTFTSIRAQLLGLDKDATAEECDMETARLKKDYLVKFKDAYGTKEINALAEQYIRAQQEGVGYVQMGVSLGSMALSMFTGGLTSAVSMGVAVTQPTVLIERATDADGLTKDELLDYGKMMLEQIPWMAVGMGAGKLGNMARSFVKLKGIQGMAAKSGQTLEDFMKVLQTAGKLDDSLVKASKITKVLAEGAGVTTETATNVGVILMVRGEDTTAADWVMSFVGAMAGTKINSKLAKMGSKDAQVKFLMDTFKDFNLTELEARKILSAMEETGYMSKALEGEPLRHSVEISQLQKEDPISTGIKSKQNVDLINREYPSLSEIDRYTRWEEKNQANLSPKRFDLVSGKAAQEQVGAYFDKILELIPDKSMEFDPEINIMYKDYILADGTVISQNFAGDIGKMVFDKAQGRWVVPGVTDKFLFWIKDVDGVEHVLPALSPENVGKAKRIMAYIQTLEEVPKENIIHAQNAKRIELTNGNKRVIDVDYLESIRTPDGNAVFDDFNIKKIMELKEKNPDFVQRFTDILSENPQLCDRFTFVEVLNLVETNPQLFEKLALLKDKNGKLLMSELYDIDTILYCANENPKIVQQLIDSSQELGITLKADDFSDYVNMPVKNIRESLIYRQKSESVINNIEKFLGLHESPDGYVFSGDTAIEGTFIKLFGEELGSTAIKNMKNPLSQQDIITIQTLLDKASMVMDISHIKPERLLFLYQNLVATEGEFVHGYISKIFTPEQCAFILNTAKGELMPKDIHDILMRYKAVPSILNDDSILSAIKDGGDVELLNPAVEKIYSYLSTQEVPTTVSCIRTEGFMPVAGRGDSPFGGCLKNVKMTGEFSGQTIEQVMKEINNITDPTMKKEAFSRLRNSVLSNNYTTVNNRFMSCTLGAVGGEGGGSGVYWNFNIQKGSHAAFVESANIKGERGIWELLVQKDSNISIKDIQFDEINNVWTIIADVNS